MAGTIATGTMLGRYRIVSLIRRGGMGEVYLAEDERLGRRVALKLPAPELAADPSFRERFLRESRLAASLEHAAIVPIYEAGEHAGRLYLAMRYVAGDDLGTIIHRDGPLEPVRAVGLLSQVADGLDAAHELGLIHRDVKPGNILVATGDHAYLTDFGLTKRRGSGSALTRTGQLVGTLEYVAPEQIQGRDVDALADQYSLGCVAFEMLAGRPPFEAAHDAALLYAHVHADRPRVSDRGDLPRSVDAAISRAMASSPQERFHTCGDFARALATALAGARSAPDGGRRRGRRTALLVATLVVVATAGVGLAVLATGPGTKGNGGSSGTAPPDGALLRLDPASGHVLTVEDIPGHQPQQPRASAPAFDLAVGEGGVWDWRGSVIIHVDPEDGELVETISTPGVGSVEMDLGHQTLWVTGEEVHLYRFNPATNDPLKALRLPTVAHPASSNAASDVAVDRRAVWVSTLVGEIVRVDPGTLEQGVATLDASFDRIAAADGWVYAVDRLASTVVILPSTQGPSGAEMIDLGSLNVDEVAAGEGRLWVLDATIGAVVPVDPTGRILEPIPVESGATDIDVGLGTVWVSSQAGTLYRIDPTTLVVAAFELHAPMVQVAADEDGGAVWVSVFDLGGPD
jgi:streptogramin lyase